MAQEKNLIIHRFENPLMNSNTYVIVDGQNKSSIIIDPASERSERVIGFIKDNSLTLEYVLITHIHPDHCLGVNSLKKAYPKHTLIYHQDKFQKREFKLFFRLVKDDAESLFDIAPADIFVQDYMVLPWYERSIKILMAPGHSEGSIVIDVDGLLFTGDTIIPYPPFFNGRGSNKKDWVQTINIICECYNENTLIYPGHGNVLTLGEWQSNENYSIVKI